MKCPPFTARVSSGVVHPVGAALYAVAEDELSLSRKDPRYGCRSRWPSLYQTTTQSPSELKPSQPVSLLPSFEDVLNVRGQHHDGHSRPIDSS